MPNPSQPTQDPDELVGAVPQFAGEEDPETEDLDPSPPQEEPTPPQTSSSPLPPPPASTTAGTSSSSTESSDGEGARAITVDDLTDAIGDIAGELFRSGGQWLNRRENHWRHRMTTRWIAHQDEVEALGTLAERYLIKQVPDQVKDNEDTTALGVGALILGGYVVRNLFGADDAPAPGPFAYRPQEQPPAREAPPAAPTAPQAPPSAPAPPPAPAAGVTTLEGSGLARAEPPPPAVITPGI